MEQKEDNNRPTLLEAGNRQQNNRQHNTNLPKLEEDQHLFYFLVLD